MSAAFEDLERTITPADAREMRSTTAIQDVRAAALQIENLLAARQALRNMRRLGPLLTGMEHYSRVVEILCNGTPFLAWIWSPITLILRVASEYVEAFEQIMKGYARISAALVRFELLSHAFITNADFQQTVGVFYADILQFHKHAYKFVRRSSWKLLFSTSWGRFQRRFDNILEDLDRHGELIDREANARNIAEARQMRQDIRTWREESLEQLKREEDRQADKQYRSILSWLKTDESEQLSIFEPISEEGAKFPGTCSWLLKNGKIAAWLQRKLDNPLLYLQGNAGCGKSFLSAQLVKFLQTSNSTVIHHFCSSSHASSTVYDGILKSLLQQLLRKNGELVAHVYQEYVLGKKQATISNLERLLQTLVASFSDDPRQTDYVWMIIDGANECEPTRQSRLVSLVNQIASKLSSLGGTVCKVLISTRPTPLMDRYLRKKQTVSLSDEKSRLESAIQLYASQRLRTMHERFRQLELDTDEVEEVEQLVAQRADGMFLYARLVLDFLSTNIFFSNEELKESIHQLPQTLTEFYQKILSQILGHLDSRSTQRITCIFSWIAFAKRPLKKLEFLSALSFSTGNPSVTNPAPRYVLDICSPLIEERRDTSLAFIHSSVKEFLQTCSSAVVINEQDALLEHSVAMVTCLLSGLEVFDATYHEQARLLRLVKGVHGFHVYATEYWTEYLLANVAACTRDLEASTTLFTLVSRLANTLEERFASLPAVLASAPNAVDARLTLLGRYPVLQKHVKRALLGRSQKRLELAFVQESSEQDIENPAASGMLDGISIMLDSYQKAVETLLDQDSCPGASVEELELFKSQFRTSAYTCRLRFCPRATIGFNNDQLRCEHERTHAGGFRCTNLNCQYPPFRSAQSLKAHVDKYHALATARKSVRRVGRFGLENQSKYSAMSADVKDRNQTQTPQVRRGDLPNERDRRPVKAAASAPNGDPITHSDDIASPFLNEEENLYPFRSFWDSPQPQSLRPPTTIDSNDRDLSNNNLGDTNLGDTDLGDVDGWIEFDALLSAEAPEVVPYYPPGISSEVLDLKTSQTSNRNSLPPPLRHENLFKLRNEWRA